MFRTSLVSSLLALTTILVGVNALTIQPSEAVERFNGQRAFEGSPRLIRTATRFSNRNSAAATYQFTIEVPDNAGEALKAVRISQIDGLETVMFNNQKNRASEGKNMAGASLPLASVGGQSQDGEITVVFATPIEPGNTVTIAVKPKLNPSSDGLYLFGLTAYPTGDNSQGMYLGSARIYIGHD